MRSRICALRSSSSVWAAREKSAHKAFKKTFFYLLAFNALYVLALKFIFFKLL